MSHYNKCTAGKKCWGSSRCRGCPGEALAAWADPALCPVPSLHISLFPSSSSAPASSREHREAPIPASPQEILPSWAGTLFLSSPGIHPEGADACCSWGCPRAWFRLSVPHSAKHFEPLGTEACWQGWLCPCRMRFLEFMLFVSNSPTL